MTVGDQASESHHWPRQWAAIKTTTSPEGNSTKELPKASKSWQFGWTKCEGSQDHYLRGDFTLSDALKNFSLAPWGRCEMCVTLSFPSFRRRMETREGTPTLGRISIREKLIAL